MLRAALILLLAAGPALAQTGATLAGRDGDAPPQPPALQIYMMLRGEQVGPLGNDDFKSKLGTPDAATSTLVWMPGMDQWQLASTVPALQGIIASIGQENTQPGAFQVPDIHSYILGAWISEAHKSNSDTGYASIIQMKILPDGRFEGATILEHLEDQAAPLQIAHEKGTWTLAPKDDGGFELQRKGTFSTLRVAEVVRTGEIDRTMKLTATGPNSMEMSGVIRFTRIPGAN